MRKHIELLKFSALRLPSYSIYLDQYKLMESHFIQRLIIHYYRYLFWCWNCSQFAQLSSAWSSWLLCPMYMLPIILWALPVLWHNNMLQVYLVLFFAALKSAVYLSSSYLHHYFYTFISISITTENHVWQSWKCASQISDCRKHNWLTVPAAMLRNPSLFQPRLCIPPAVPSQWLSTADILRQAYCWDLGPLWWATPAQGLLVSFAETPITAPQLRLFQLNLLFFPSSLFHKAKAYSTVWCAGSPSSSKSLSFPQSLACLVPSWHQFLRKPEPTYYEFTQIPHNTHNKIPIQQSAVHFSFLPLFIPPFSDYEKPGFHYL